jgi:hypothetical protein
MGASTVEIHGLRQFLSLAGDLFGRFAIADPTK